MDKLKKNMELLKQFNNEFKYIFDMAFKTVNCTNTQCKKQLEEFKKAHSILFNKMLELIKKQNNIEEVKKHNDLIDRLRKEQMNNKFFIEYNKLTQQQKKEPTNEKDKEIVIKFNKLTKIFFKNLKKLRKNLPYKNNKIYKDYQKKINQILKDLENLKERAELSKCSFDNCLKLHKEGIILIKKLTEKLCKIKIKKSCKIYKNINNLNLDKITFKDNEKLIKLIKKGYMH